MSHLRLDERPLVLEAGDILRHQVGRVEHVADALRRNQDVIRHVAELHRRTEAAFDGPAELPDERETATRGEQGVREREAVLHDRRRVLVASEHRGAAIAFLDVAASTGRLFSIGPFAAAVDEEYSRG